MTTSLMSSGQIRAGTAQLRATARRHRHDRFPLSPSASGRPWSARLVRLLLVRPLLAFLLLLCVAGSSAGQPIAFGKNKVQYSDFEWRLLESEHFQLYFYEGEEELARLALDAAEVGYRDLRVKFAHEVKGRIPLIIYSSHQDFEQTNITPYFLPEGVAGLTEFARGRVLIPYGGSWPEFRTTLVHELVHVFQRSYLDETFSRYFRPGGLEPPLWFTEGLAVHWSEERDREADMVLRDLVLNGGLPTIEEFWRYDGSFTVYKLGQSMLDYIGLHYGEDRIHLFYRDLWRWRTFEEGIEDLLGISARELSARWAFDLKERYFPEVEEAEPAAFASRPLTRAGAEFKPVPLPDSLPGLPRGFAFLSGRDGFTNVYLASRDGEESGVTSVVEGERKAGFESFHEYRSRMDVAADGTLIFVSQHRDQDEVVLFSLTERRVIERHRFADLVGLLSPSFSADGRRFVVSGLSRDGHSDLYLYDRDRSRLRRLTHDRYQDLDPAYSPWEEAVVWASDRAAGGESGKVANLFRLDLTSGAIRQLTRGEWKDAAPVFDLERRGLMFVSDRDGWRNVYWIDETGTGRRLTQSLDAIFDPRPVRGEPRFLATVFSRGRFQIRSFAFPDSSGPGVTLAPSDAAVPWVEPQAERAGLVSVERSYRPRFGLDVAQGGVLVDPGARAGEGVQAALSDMMGNHLIFMQLGNSTAVTSDFLRNFSAGVTYVNLSRRLNYGLSAFHFSGDSYDAYDLPYHESRSGGGVLLSYPFSKFERIETHLNLAYTETDRSSVSFYRKAGVATHSISLIHDTSLWLPTGPIDGARWNLTAGLALNLRQGASESTLLLADYRRYLRLGFLSAYAFRAQGRFADGDNPALFDLGGSHSLRLYPRRVQVGRHSALLNQEVRFPLLRGLALGLPMGNLELPGVEGALFVDAGSAWDRGQSPEWRGAYGMGFRLGLGGLLVMRLDVGRRTDWKRFSPSTHIDFFIGWNYRCFP